MFRKQFSDDQIQSYEICSEIDTCLNRLISDEKLAVAVSKQYVESIPIRSQFFCFETFARIQAHQKSILIRNDSIFIAEINMTIGNLFDSGIMFKWLKDFRLQEAVTNEVEMANALYVIIVFVGVILIMPLLILCFEIVVFKKCREKNTRNFWKYAEWLIDGERHLFVLDQNFVCDKI